MELRVLFDDPSSIGLVPKEIGHLYLESGELFCCDPFVPNGPIKHGFGPGFYPVTLWYKDEDLFGERVAFASVRFSPGIPIEFFEACYRIGSASSSGLAVFSGLASFMDAKAALAFEDLNRRHDAANPERSFYDVHLAAEFAKSATVPGAAGSWAIYAPIPDDPANIVMFASGIGDGAYRVYWGEVDPGNPEAPLACLIADFGLCDVDVDE